jgi:hypothetical protein
MLSRDELSKWSAAVPDYQKFLSLEELDESSRILADEFPDWVKLDTVGHSSEQRPIHLLTVGKGSRSALFIGAPHPNEPIGTLTLDFMSRHLCEDRELASRYDCQFHFIKVADPDGLKLNEGWLKSPFTPLSYALNYYSPPHAEQVEWGFPIRYKTLEFLDAPDETRAVMSVMNHYRPRFLYSLHNGIFCGVYFYLSRRSAPLFEALHSMVSELGMTLDRGEPDGPGIKPWARAIYPLFGAREMYDYMEETFGPNPPRLIGGGTSADDYLSTIAPERTSIVTELPYFTEPALADDSPSGTTRREAIGTAIDNVATALQMIKSNLVQLRPRLSDSRLLRSVEDYLLRMPANLEGQRNALGSDEYSREATRAEFADMTLSGIFQPTLQLGMLRRLADSVGDEERTAQIEAHLREQFHAIESNYRLHIFPIRQLVSVQLGAGLLALTECLEGLI